MTKLRISWLWIAVLLLVGMAGGGYAQDNENLRELSYDEAFFTYFTKQKKQPGEGDIHVYMSTIYEDEYRDSSRNEFARRRLKQKTEEEIASKLKDFNIAGQYVVAETKSSLDEYDFARNMFTLNRLYGYYSISGRRADLGDADIMVVFSNADNFKFFPIEPEEAEKFLESRANRYGNFDKSIGLLIFFKVGEANDAFNRLVTSKRFNGHWYFLNGVIDKVEVWDQKRGVKIGELIKG